MIFRRLLTKDHSALLCKLYFKKKQEAADTLMMIMIMTQNRILKETTQAVKMLHLSFQY